MGEYQVGRFERRNGAPLAPGSLVYIRQTGHGVGGAFRVSVGANGAAGAVSQLTGGSAWTPVAGGLRVDTSRHYAALWLTPQEAANFRTEVLLHAIDGHSQSYRAAIRHDDASHQRLRVAHYVPVTVSAVNNGPAQYWAPGLEQTVTLGSQSGTVNFLLSTQWQTSATTGYLIQEVMTQMSAFRCNGAQLNVPGNHYFEAWQITGPNTFLPNAWDHWTIQTGVGTYGTWSKNGRVFWVPSLDPAWNLTPGGVSHAVDLLSSLAAHDLGTVLLNRRVGGEWNGCNGSGFLNTHVAH